MVNFEGNANAIRILTHKQTGKDEGGTQLTYTTLASIAKYPCEAIAKKKGHVNRKKFGFSKVKTDVSEYCECYQNDGGKRRTYDF